MKLFVLLILLSFFFILPVRAQAADEVVKSYCASLLDYDTLEDLKAAILIKAKRLASDELFGEMIIASTLVENFVVTSDQIEASSVGFIRLRGNVEYSNGTSLGEICVTITAYVTAEERRQFALYLDALRASLAVRSTPTPTPTRRPRITRTPLSSVATPTPNRTTTARIDLTQTAESRATHVQQTVEAIQEATRVQQEVDVRLTQLAPTATATARSTSTPTRRPTSTPTPRPSNTPTPVALSIEVITDDLNIRSGPGTQYERIAKVSTGHVFIPVGRDDTISWLQVCCVNGQTGWVVVNAEYISVKGNLHQLPVLSPPTPMPTCSVEGIFQTVWQSRQSQLGCTQRNAQATSVTVEPFEYGYMVWVKATDKIYVLPRGNLWSEHVNPWRPGEDSFACGEARAIGYPTMGFGKIWCQGARQQLGQPLDREIPRDVGSWQVFSHGRAFLGYNDLFLILYDNGTWEASR